MTNTNRVGIDEATRHFGISTKTIRRWIQSGRLPAQKLYKGKGYEYLIDISGYSPEQSPAQQDIDIETPDERSRNQPVRGETQQESDMDNMSIALEAKNELIKHLQEEITEKNRQIGEILLVLRQTQILLPEAKQKKHRWWPFSKDS